MKVIGSRQEDSAFVKLHLPGLIGHAGLRSHDAGARRDVAVIGAIENQDVLRIRHRQQISIRIHGQPHQMPEIGLRSHDHAHRRGIAVIVPAKDVDALAGKAGHENLVDSANPS